MTDMTLADGGAAPAASRSTALYRAVWRWHFYAGLYVVPFLIMLAVTGLIMLWSAALYGRNGENTPVSVGQDTVAVSRQAEAAAAAVPGGAVSTYIAPNAPDHVAAFRVDLEGASWIVLVDPYTGSVVGKTVRNAGWYDLADKIHGTLLIGDIGDRLVEVAASLGIVLVATGTYLWWPRGRRTLGRAFTPDFSARRRTLWKSLHQTVGAWVAIILVLFLVSGLSWAGVWGEKLTQAWSTFPAEKWDTVPVSDATHASMNHGGEKEVPWALEQTPMPASGSKAGAQGVTGSAPPTLDAVVAYARSQGFVGRMQVNLPAGNTGVWTISRDTMSKDSHDPTSDRTVHLDRYTGNLLADIRFADYSAGGKAMAVAIPFHEGDMGLWNVAFNTVFCLSVIFLSGSGIVMWLMRRPSGAFAAPLYHREYRLTAGVVVIAVVLGVLFPLGGLAILLFAIIDALLPAGLKRAGVQAA